MGSLLLGTECLSSWGSSYQDRRRRDLDTGAEGELSGGGAGRREWMGEDWREGGIQGLEKGRRRPAVNTSIIVDVEPGVGVESDRSIKESSLGTSRDEGEGETRETRGFSHSDSIVGLVALDWEGTWSGGGDTPC